MLKGPWGFLKEVQAGRRSMLLIIIVTLIIVISIATIVINFYF